MINNRSTIFGLLLVFLLAGCNATLRTVVVLDENGNPIKGMPVLGREQNMTIVNYAYLKETDSEGKVRFKLRELGRLVAAKKGYISGSIVTTDESITLTVSEYKDSLPHNLASELSLEYVEMKANNIDYKLEDEKVLEEWLEFLKWLEDKGIFDELVKGYWYKSTYEDMK